MEVFYPVSSAAAEFEIKKSKFISYLYPVENEKQAKEKIAFLKKEHKNAAHVVHGFITGQSKSNKGMSDDGEPSGTAGKPILSMIDAKNFTNLVVIVVRYYGGIKLGTGGLVKAYSDAADLVIKETEFKRLRNEKEIEIIFSYRLEGIVNSFLESKGIRIKEKNYSDKIALNIIVEEEFAQVITNELTNLGSGRIQISSVKK